LSGSSSLKSTFTGGVTAGSFVDQGTFVGAGTSSFGYAVYDSAGFVRVIASGAGDSDYSTSFALNRHVKLAATAATGTQTIYTLHLNGGTVGATINSNTVLTLSKGGIAKSGAGSSTISGSGTANITT